MTNSPSSGIHAKALRQLVCTLLVVVGVAIVALALLFGQELLSGWFVLGFVLLMLVLITAVLWVSLVSYALFALSSDARERALRAAHPDATLIHVVVTAPVMRQLRALATNLGMPASAVRARTYVTLAADASTITFYGGSTPRELLSVPRSALASAEVVTTTAAKRLLPSVRLVFAAMRGEPIVLVPVYWPGVAPKPVPQEQLEAQVAAIGAARG